MVSRGFFGRKRPQPDRPVPPGQYLENGFPVLTAGPTPRNSLDTWTFKLVSTAGEDLAFWSWSQMQALTQTELLVDIHCVTKWSKQDTTWRGVTINTLLADARSWLGCSGDAGLTQVSLTIQTEPLPFCQLH